MIITHPNYGQSFDAHTPFTSEQIVHNMTDSHIVDSYIATEPHDKSSLTVDVVDEHNDSVHTLHSTSEADHDRVLSVARSELAVSVAIPVL